MRRRPPRSTPLYSSAASDVYKRQPLRGHVGNTIFVGGADEALLASDHVLNLLRQLWHSLASSSIEVIPIDRHHCRARKLAPGDQQGSGVRAHAYPAQL